MDRLWFGFFALAATPCPRSCLGASSCGRKTGAFPSLITRWHRRLGMPGPECKVNSRTSPFSCLLLPCSWYSKKRTGATADCKRDLGRNSPAWPVTGSVCPACAQDRTASWAQPQAMNVVFKISPWAQCARLGWEVQVALTQPFFSSAGIPRTFPMNKLDLSQRWVFCFRSQSLWLFKEVLLYIRLNPVHSSLHSSIRGLQSVFLERTKLPHTLPQAFLFGAELPKFLPKYFLVSYPYPPDHFPGRFSVCRHNSQSDIPDGSWPVSVVTSVNPRALRHPCFRGYVSSGIFTAASHSEWGYGLLKSLSIFHSTCCRVILYLHREFWKN